MIAFLSGQPGAYRKLLGPLSDEAASARPQPGKWNVKEIIGHLCDAERVQSYRALRFARGDQKELQGFEQDDYVREAHSDARTLKDLLDEFEGIRNSTLALFKSFRQTCGSVPEWPTALPSRCAPWPISSPATPSIITNC